MGKDCGNCGKSKQAKFRKKKVKKTTFLNQQFSGMSVLPNEDNQRNRIINITTNK